MLNYYRNCDEIPIYNFYKVLQEKDYNHLYPEFDGYVDLSGDKTTMQYYELMGDILHLTTRYKVVSALLTILATSAMEKEVTLLYIAELKSWDYVINTKNPFEKEIEKMVLQLKQSESKLEELKKENSSGESFTLTEQQVALELALNKNEIDIKKVSVSKWIAMMSRAKNIKEQERKQQQNNG